MLYRSPAYTFTIWRRVLGSTPRVHDKTIMTIKQVRILLCYLLSTVNNLNPFQNYMLRWDYSLYVSLRNHWITTAILNMFIYIEPSVAADDMQQAHIFWVIRFFVEFNFQWSTVFFLHIYHYFWTVFTRYYFTLNMNCGILCVHFLFCIRFFLTADICNLPIVVSVSVDVRLRWTSRSVNANVRSGHDNTKPIYDRTTYWWCLLSLDQRK